jgi:hypothetical protein
MKPMTIMRLPFMKKKTLNPPPQNYGAAGVGR